MPANSDEEILGVSLCRPYDVDDQGGIGLCVQSEGKRTWQRQGLPRGELLHGAGGIFNTENLK